MLFIQVQTTVHNVYRLYSALDKADIPDGFITAFFGGGGTGHEKGNISCSMNMKWIWTVYQLDVVYEIKICTLQKRETNLDLPAMDMLL